MSELGSSLRKFFLMLFGSVYAIGFYNKFFYIRFIIVGTEIPVLAERVPSITNIKRLNNHVP